MRRREQVMVKRFRVSRTLPRRLEELGVSPAAVLRNASLPAGLFDQERVLLTTEQLFALYRGIAAASDDPAFALRLGSEERLERLDPIGVAALCARSFREGLERLARYKQLTCPERIELVDRDRECKIQFAWSLAREPEPALLADVCFAAVINLGRRGSGRGLNAKRVELSRPPAHRELYQQHFGCLVKFNAERNAIVFDAADMERPFTTHNPDLLGAVAPQLEAELTRHLEQKTLRDEVKGAVKRLLGGRPPRLEDVAKEVGLSVRTLQRRLTAEDASFQVLINDARRELARHYLLQPALDLDETAYLLGYEDANSFFRAFHRWEGVSPGEWRAEHRARAGTEGDDEALATDRTWRE